MHNHAQITHATVTDDQLAELVQFTMAHVYAQGCTLDQAMCVVRAWHRFA